MNIVLLGAPGTGKGTQADLLVSDLNFYHISTGELFRKALSQKTALGIKAGAYINQGKLVPDAVVICLIEEVFTSTQFKKNNLPFILDGFPRTLAQALALDNLLKKTKQTLHKVVYLHVSQQVLMERLTGRRVSEKSGRVYHLLFHPPQKKEGFCDVTGERLIQREDDTKQAVKERLKAYTKQTLPLIEYYNKKNILVKINGEGSQKEVFTRIKTTLPKRF